MLRGPYVISLGPAFSWQYAITVIWTSGLLFVLIVIAHRRICWISLTQTHDKHFS